MTKEKALKLMNEAGYIYDELESGKGHLRFFQANSTGCGIDSLYFKTWKEAGEWAKEVSE